MSHNTGKTTASASSRPQARSLHIGLNSVNPADYGGWDGPLAACEFDAHDMAALARSQGLTPNLLITKKATRAAVLAGLRRAAKTLKAGDFFFLSYSGHGGQVPDTNRDERDRKDETWCLFASRSASLPPVCVCWCCLTAATVAVSRATAGRPYRHPGSARA